MPDISQVDLAKRRAMLIAMCWDERLTLILVHFTKDHIVQSDVFTAIARVETKLFSAKSAHNQPT